MKFFYASGWVLAATLSGLTASLEAHLFGYCMMNHLVDGTILAQSLLQDGVMCLMAQGGGAEHVT